MRKKLMDQNVPQDLFSDLQRPQQCAAKGASESYKKVTEGFDVKHARLARWRPTHIV